MCVCVSWPCLIAIFPSVRAVAEIPAQQRGWMIERGRNNNRVIKSFHVKEGKSRKMMRENSERKRMIRKDGQRHRSCKWQALTVQPDCTFLSLSLSVSSFLHFFLTYFLSLCRKKWQINCSVITAEWFSCAQSRSIIRISSSKCHQVIYPPPSINKLYTNEFTHTNWCVSSWLEM